MKELFPGDSYATPEGSRYFSDRLLFWTRWNLYFRFFHVVLKSRSLAKKGLFTDDAMANLSFDIIRDVEGCGGRITIKGLDNIRRVEGPVVFICNHMSTLEAVVLPAIVSSIKPVAFVIKERLKKGPFFGPIMAARDFITVTRKDPRKDLTDVLTQGLEKLKAGRSIFLFPQSTERARSVVFDPAKFNSLGIKLASRAGVPVVPAAVKTDFWGDGKFIRGFGRIERKEPIHFEFGEPITVSGRGKLEHERALGFILGRLEEWKVPIAEPAALPGPTNVRTSPEEP